MDTQTITVTFDYDEPYLPTPRHRIPHMRRVNASYDRAIPTVTSEQAPVVLRVPVNGYVDEGLGPEFVSLTADLRGYDGRLYEPLAADGSRTTYEIGRPVKVGSDHFPTTRTIPNIFRRLAEAHEAIDATFDTYLIIDGRVWVQTTEPRYVVHTYGMGHNHGGTSLAVEKHGEDGHAHPATDAAKVITKALAVAEERGDDQSLERIRTTELIEVLDPSYVKVPHVADVHAQIRAEIEAQVAEAVAILNGTDESLYERLSAVRTTLEDARDRAWKYSL